MAQFKFNKNALEGMVNNYQTRSQAAIEMYADTSALKLQNYARENRPWTDRTGHARQRLTGFTGKTAHGVRVYIAHGVEYGVYLEKAHEQKYAILEKTVLEVGSKEILPGFSHLLDRLEKHK